MTAPARDSQFIGRYLLGELPEAEQEAFESEYFASPQAFEELLAVEDELIDAYLAGRLAPPERERFEQFFLVSPERRERLEMARGLKQLALQAPPAAPPDGLAERRGLTIAPRWAAAAAALLLLVGAGSLVRLQTLRGELQRSLSAEASGQARQAALQSELADIRARVERLQQELTQAQARVEALARATVPAAAAVRVATLTLLPGLRRDPEQRPTLLLARGFSGIRLRLRQSGQAYARYSARVETPDGDAVLTREPLPLTGDPSGAFVDLRLEAGQLPDGHYVIALRGIGPGGQREDVADYAFRVLRSN